MTIFESLQGRVPIRQWIQSLALSRATLYRIKNPSIRKKSVLEKKRSSRALSPQEVGKVRDVLHSPRFLDVSPAHIWATLLDEGIYHCSVRTMYRILTSCGESNERRPMVHHQNYTKPELLATGPNQVWSWDITTLRGPMKWTYFYLYVLLDIFSRYVVGWLIAERQTGALGRQLIEESFRKHNIQEPTLKIHNDRGSPMKSKPVAHLMADLGITQSFSRPHVSNDNPFSESQFKTMKYSSHFPDRFGSLTDAYAFGRTFFPWYNTEHKHSSLGYHTPKDIHYGRAQELRDLRQITLSQAYAQHPERFVQKSPTPPSLPTAVWINPPKDLSTIEPSKIGWPAKPQAEGKPLAEVAAPPEVHEITSNPLRPTNLDSQRKEFLH